MASSINDAYLLLKRRSADKGATGNINPDMFNIIWPRAELRFFNNAFSIYAQTQTVSDSISKWMSDPIYLLVPGTGRYNFFTGMNLIHVDSMSGFLPVVAPVATGSTGGLNALVAGSGYTNGTYDSVVLTGGTGSGVSANITVVGGVVTSINYLNSIGVGYTVGDTLTTIGLPAGTGFSIKVSTLVDPTQYEVSRTEKSKIAANVSSTYDAPDREFPIYTQFSSWFQFYPLNIGPAELVYLKQPIPSFWNYTLNGYIDTLTGIVAGTTYTNGTYTNVPLTGGSGSGALATIVVSGDVVSTITVTKAGKLYRIGDILSASAANIGGTGTGFTITVAGILNPRPYYNATGSVQPLWNDNDISLIVDYALEDIAVNMRDIELQQFAMGQSQSKTLQ
jgi:hypothetical protein